MAVIHEKLTLDDYFSATFTKFLQYGEKAAGSSQRAAQAASNYQSALNSLDRRLISTNAQFASMMQEQQRMAAAGQQNTAAFADLDKRMEKLGGTIRDLTAQYDFVERQANEAAQAANKFASANKTAQTSSTDLSRSLKGLLGGYLSFQSVKSVFNLSDQLASTNARLQMMTGSAEAAAAAQDEIYAAAMRSRGAYTDMADTVAKLGTLAGDAFGSTNEIIAFAEQLQKQMAMSGTSTDSAQEAMRQLAQGLSSGALRGEELNSVLDQTPMIAQTIADSLGVTTGQMLEMASEGALTADVVKNAILGAADETNAAFEQMPYTWGQVWTTIQNIAIEAFQPIINAVGRAADFIANNLDTIVPVLYGVAAAVGVLATAYVIWKAATLAQAIAQGALNTALLASPVTWIVLGIALVVGALAAWVKSVGGVKVAWLIFVDAILYAWDWCEAALKTGIYAVMNWLDNMSLTFKRVGVNVQNWIGEMKVGVLTILQNMVNGAIDIINWFIEKLNKIPGVAIEPIEHTTFAATAAAAEQAAKAAREAELMAAEQEIAARQAERAQIIADMWTQRETNHALRQAEIEAAKAEAADSSDSPWTPGENPYNSPQLDDIAGSVSSIEKAVDMSQEDLKMLVDESERRYVNRINLTSQTPVITVNGANTGRTAADRQSLANAIRDILIEQTAAGSVISTAVPVVG